MCSKILLFKYKKRPGHNTIYIQQIAFDAALVEPPGRGTGGSLIIKRPPASSGAFLPRLEPGDYKSWDALFSYWVKNVFFKEIQNSYLHRYSSYHVSDYIFL
jgi:hypothetical protein